MKQINDAIIILNVSSDMLGSINNLYNRCIYEEDLSTILKVNIKNYLENIRSSLDYVANYLFDTYCSNNYTQKELKKIKNKIYFPIYSSEEKFTENINKKFKGLPINIISVLEKHQAYNNNKWLDNLVSIVNASKHIELMRNKRTESGKINYLEDINGNKFINCSFKNCRHAAVINGIPLTNNNALSNSYIKYYDGDIYAEYYFSNTDTPVIDTLNEILNGASSIIADLKKIL